MVRAIVLVSCLMMLAFVSRGEGEEMPQQVLGLTANLSVESMEESVDFWKQLGFAVTMCQPEQPPWQWVALENNGHQVMLQTRESFKGEQEELGGFGEPGVASMLFLQVEDAPALLETLDGLNVLKQPYTTFYGMTEFVLKDPNGFIVVVASRNSDRETGGE